MALVRLQDVSIGFGGPALLENISLRIEQGERVCLIGRNGMGKSTLMKLVQGEVVPDDGEIHRAQDLKIAYLAQEVPNSLHGPVFEVVARGLGKPGELLQQYHQLSHQLAEKNSARLIQQLEILQDTLESTGGWNLQQRVDAVLSRMDLNPEAEFGDLSGGLKRRVLLAQALVCEPELLLLDEPTNHLDVDGILWLEEFFASYQSAILFVTHDRILAQKLATRILDLDRGRLSSWLGGYEDYLSRKQELLDAESKQQALFNRELAKEEAWIRQGIKARRTRDQGRVSRLRDMRAKRSARRDLIGQSRMQVQQSELSGKKVIEAEGIGFSYGGTSIVKDFSTLIVRGDRVGVLGPNGVGKTTLLKLLLGTLVPESGRVTTGTRLECAYFDQHRAQLDLERTVQDNINDGKDHIIVNGTSTHVIGYLQNFLFSPARARTPVKALSGGEKNRLLLARLFSRPSNMLVLDEPTNDLDVETLELLEEQLLHYQGTVLLVSHDRAFINNVVTSTMAFEGNGNVREYVGGYDDWLRQRAESKSANHKDAQNKEPVRRRQKGKTKLGYRETQELKKLPETIAELEREQEAMQTQLSDPEFYKDHADKVSEVTLRLEELGRLVVSAYARWEELEDQGIGSSNGVV